MSREDVDLIEAGNQPFCFTVRDNDGVFTTDPYDNDPDAGELEVIDLVLGKYTVEETIRRPGTTSRIPWSRSVQLPRHDDRSTQRRRRAGYDLRQHQGLSDHRAHVRRHHRYAAGRQHRDP